MSLQSLQETCGVFIQDLLSFSFETECILFMCELSLAILSADWMLFIVKKKELMGKIAHYGH